MVDLVAVWAVPRSASTAFERSVAQRGDLEVVSEPFSAAYYDGPQARSSRFAPTAPDATFAAVRARLLSAAASRPTFVKDMAYQVLPAADAELVERTRHTFLVRDPRWSLASMAARWPDFTTDEAGFTAVAALIERVEATGRPVVVIDSDDLRRDPVGMTRAWCDAVGLDFEPRALGWEPGLRGGWERWEDWHAATAASTGFVPPDPEPPEVSDVYLAAAIEEATPLYRAIVERRLRPSA
jgi:hypothetical protein